MRLALPSVASAAGFVDSIQILGYLFDFGPVPIQFAAIVIKVVLAAFRPTPSVSADAGLRFSAVLSGLLVASFLASPFKDGTVLVQVVAFWASLSLSVFLTPGRVLVKQYTISVALFVAVASGIYIVMAYSGMVATRFGRYEYFGGSAANLGAEITAIGFVAAAIAFSLRTFVACTPIYIWPILLLQGRSSVLACLAALLVRLAFDYRGALRRQPTLSVLAFVVLIPAGLWVAIPYVQKTANDVLLLDNSKRGLGTGFVGRSDRWANSWYVFEDYPFLGGGPAAFSKLNIDDPHNFFLIGLSTLGLTFAIVLGLMLRSAVMAYRQDSRSTLILAMSMMPLAFFNDRFANMAPYPFVSYVLLLGLAGGSTTFRTERPVRR